MEAKDETEGFDFSGIYEDIKEYELISYAMDDNRRVKVTFSKENNKTKVIILFEAENENSIEFQKQGWQTILDNFKDYVEKSKTSS